MLDLDIIGLEIIGSHLVDVLDYYHFMGIANLVCLGLVVNEKSFLACHECKVIQGG